jgi:regulator of RNase E activity RraA
MTVPSTGNVGFRIFRDIQRLPRAVVEAFAKIETPYITDAMNRFGGMVDNIRPADDSMRCAGPAVTVRVAPGDNLMVYAAFEVARPGDVLVIEARGFTSVAQWGDHMSLVAQKLGLAGAVTDGSLRDLLGIRQIGFPVFARPWVVPNGARRDGPGEINVPVAVGGVPVLPGDLVVADDHGVAVVPRADAEAVLLKAHAMIGSEPGKLREIRGGKPIPDWLAETLSQKGVEVVDGRYDDPARARPS